MECEKEEEVYTVKVYYYPDGDVGLQVLDETLVNMRQGLSECTMLLLFMREGPLW